MWKQDKPEGKRGNVDSEVAVEENGESPSGARPELAEDVSAFIGKGVEFKGTISYNGTVRIDGCLDGEIHTEGVLLVGEEAVLTAKVSAGTIVCKGKITGDIIAKEKIKLRAPAVINGGVKTPMLSIEEGVFFNGTLEMAEANLREVPRETGLYAVGTPAGQSMKRVAG